MQYSVPGQRDASLLWSECCACPLEAEGYEKSVASPRYFVSPRMTRPCLCVLYMHVDDLQVAGKPSDVTSILQSLASKVKRQVEGPFLKEPEYRNGFSTSLVRFLAQVQL